MAENQASVAADLNKLKVAELKKLCEEKGLIVTGKKADLVERLQQAEDGLDDPTADHELDELLKETEDEELQFTSEKESTEVEEEPKAEPEKPKEISKIVFDEAPAAKTQPEVSPQEKLKSRADRFGGAASAEVQKQLRADRFGLDTTKKSESGVDNAGNEKGVVGVDKLKKRAERFGAVTSSSLTQVESMNKLKTRAQRFGQVTSTALVKEESSDKLKKRAERFGVVTAPTLSKVDQEERILKRKQKFGAITVADSADVEAAKKKRAERFGAVTA